jgi:SAM-dependent methyltransferase
VATSIETWPGADRREPPRGLPSWSIRRPLAYWLRDEAARAGEQYGRARVLDVGCGVKPYYPLFADAASEYVGVDVQENPHADVHGAVEALPLPDASFDVVLCTQVLEHADDPARVVSEIHRVLKPAGAALISTHGAFVFHPTPPPERDFWRWTHAGLSRLLRASGSWGELRVQANGEYVSCVFYLLCRLLGWPLGAAPASVRGLVYGVLNRTAELLERRLPADLRVPNPGSLTANYLVSARREP